MNIAVIGTGYVGTVTGSCFAESGNHVICVDSDQQKVRALKAGDPVIFEPGLAELLRRNQAAGRLSFTESIKEAVENSEIIFMTVGTPQASNGDADLSFLKAAVLEVGRSMSGYRIIVNKSTVPIGTYLKVAEWLKSVSNHPFDVVSNPEFLREGSAIRDFLYPDRVVIGSGRKDVFDRLSKLYLPFASAEKIIQMDTLSAELTKYASNAFLATRISFMNELASLCEKIGANIEFVKTGMGADSRIGGAFLNAGIGYGGSCFPKDIRALLTTAARVGVPLRIVEATEDINEKQKRLLIQLLEREYGKGSLKGRVLALWGIAFKPDTDDIREAPAVALIQELLKVGARVRAYDPAAARNAEELFGREVVFCKTSYEAADGAEGLIIATEWQEFLNPKLPLLKEMMARPVIFDGRNTLDPMQVLQAGFQYYGIGNGAGTAAGVRNLRSMTGMGIRNSKNGNYEDLDKATGMGIAVL
ncbi:MAG TPA: UDP-glucose/GDP-mannose dehydrogenase family protein [Bdellovibrionota bacterium]|nr:UDP-glucose/GDP-mannose dehydrogenase family protein [Bdellovibrionota bacterium]